MWPVISTVEPDGKTSGSAGEAAPTGTSTTGTGRPAAPGRRAFLPSIPRMMRTTTRANANLTTSPTARPIKDRPIRRPHLGHDFAFLLTFPPQSGHVVSRPIVGPSG